MILLTGGGAFANACKNLFECDIISARNATDDDLSEMISKCQTIVHNAALIDATSLKEYVDSNFLLTKRLIDIASIVNPGIKFINIGSMSYLKTDDKFLDASQMSHYAFSKFLGEVYGIKSSLKNFCSVRFSTIFYKNHHRDGLSSLGYDGVKFRKIKLLNDGSAERDFIPLNIAAAYVFKLTTQSNLPETINIASGKSLSFKHFSNIVTRHFPSVKIENSENSGNQVLSNFNISPLEKIGTIEFDIDMEFEKYIFSLNENADLQ